MSGGINFCLRMVCKAKDLLFWEDKVCSLPHALFCMGLSSLKIRSQTQHEHYRDTLCRGRRNPC